MWLLFGKVAGKSQIRYSHVAMLIQEDIGWLQIPIHYVPLVHVLEP